MYIVPDTNSSLGIKQIQIREIVAVDVVWRSDEESSR